jgi:hypothetical protein
VQCPCGRAFQQHDAQPRDDGIRFVCDCGLDLLEVRPS